MQAALAGQIGDAWLSKQCTAERHRRRVAMIGDLERDVQAGRSPATVASLIRLLGRAGLPQWFKGDVVGSLPRLTGQRFAYDFAAWEQWGRMLPPAEAERESR